MNNNILENINNYDKLKEENKINEIIKIIKNKVDINNIQKSKNNLNILQNEQLFNLNKDILRINSTKYFHYFYDIISLFICENNLKIYYKSI